MATDYYSVTGNPSTNAQATSATMRAEFTAIETGFGKLPTFSGNGSKIVAVNSGATALEAITTTGTGSGVRATSPTLVTPTLGVATATSVNKVTITAPVSGSTLTIADGKTLTVNATATISNALTFAGTDSTTMTFPGTSASIARIDAAQSFSGNQTFTGDIIAATAGKRIKIDGSNATRANRTLVVDNTTNSGTNLGVIPNGTNNVAALTVFSSSDPDNSHFIQISTATTATTINTSAVGTGTQRALELQIGGSTKLTLATTGAATFAAGVTITGAATCSGGLAVTGTLDVSDYSWLQKSAESGTVCVIGSVGGSGIVGLVSILFGSGAPATSSGIGSLYLRTDGSSTSTRLYVSKGGGSWAAVTTDS